MKKILVVNGPNINMLGKRNKDFYGSLTLEEINHKMRLVPGFEFEFFQSNHEGAIIDKLQEALQMDGIIINPAAYTHTSVGIRDALEILQCPKVEVHLSEVDQRDDFRKINYIRDVCDICFAGKKEESYMDAIKYLKNFYNMV